MERGIETVTGRALRAERIAPSDVHRPRTRLPAHPSREVRAPGFYLMLLRRNAAHASRLRVEAALSRQNRERHPSRRPVNSQPRTLSGMLYRSHVAARA